MITTEIRETLELINYGNAGKQGNNMIKQLFKEISEVHPVLSSKQPLMIGIKDDIKETYPGIRSRNLYGLMSYICRNDAYLKASIAGNPRYSLDGTGSGTVTAEQAVYAQNLLSQRKQDRKKPPTPCDDTPEIKQAEKAPATAAKSPIITIKKKRFAITLKRKGSNE